MEKQVIKVKVIPKASKSEVVGFEGEVLKVRLNAVPEKGEASWINTHSIFSKGRREEVKNQEEDEGGP